MRICEPLSFQPPRIAAHLSFGSIVLHLLHRIMNYFKESQTRIGTRSHPFLLLLVTWSVADPRFLDIEVYVWTDMWRSLVSLAKFVVSKIEDLRLTKSIDDLINYVNVVSTRVSFERTNKRNHFSCMQIFVTFDFACVWGHVFLDGNSSTELLYEILRASSTLRALADLCGIAGRQPLPGGTGAAAASEGGKKRPGGGTAGTESVGNVLAILDQLESRVEERRLRGRGGSISSSGGAEKPAAATSSSSPPSAPSSSAVILDAGEVLRILKAAVDGSEELELLQQRPRQTPLHAGLRCVPPSIFSMLFRLMAILGGTLKRRTRTFSETF
jgi:hypothetical protein